ncbi:vitamin B12-dependent ribonucleotide reductase [Planctomyces sp. SH-PL14]|uniref:vitamin B12-dependent ribonucleotide reductase n=1 Tax=Planctomyces sp. SH-PL14 TaxID=1632864 RepID=UPI00078C80EB|nr:vitamin B12-dependent ribonucleotide reductase [Planctomyces sp. SH-PL14]AMV16702.1 Vitamin B12-dependent ribonucleotide reductase [Planctomyces sp. SH-PL14]
MQQAKGTSPTGHGVEPMRIEPYFCPVSGDPFDTVEWDYRTAAIKDENGKVLFEQTDCEVPKDWSALATNVVVSKYFFGEHGTNEREKSVKQVIHRVARTIADWGLQDGYFSTTSDGENFYRELAWLCLHQHAAFNSPVWFNVGLYHQYGIKGSVGNYNFDVKTHQIRRPETPYEYPQASACFIQSVDDNMEGIMRLATSEAMLFKFGSGTGTDLSTIRSSREKLSGGGTPSGPLSFMRVYDQIAAVVKSGGKTRRAAKMQSLKDWHPDILDFIECKLKEEKKARILIDSGEYDSNFNGEAYSSIMFQNANLSVRISDEFMHAVEHDGEWRTHWVTNPSHAGPTFKARELMRKMSEGAWFCGDPGVQYETTINKWHTCKKSGPINASNPCSEYMFLDDTACNLSSINLKKCLKDDGTFDVERFRRACAIMITAQEILVDHASYPTPAIAENSHMFRPLGLGYANLGSLLMTMGMPYDSDAGRGICGALTALLNGQGYATSAQIAGHIGPFAGYKENEASMLQVMQMHRDAVEKIHPACPQYLRDAARQVWNEALQLGRRHGYRNAQATVLAPTGTIAFMMDCDTTGIEPDIALIKYKQLAGGGIMKIINRTVPHALKTLGYDQPQIDGILKYMEEEETIEGAPELKGEHLPVFDCAFKAAKGTRTIAWKAHVTMMAAAQPFLSGAISKTVNMPADSTVEDIEQAYIEGWKLGLKALAIYRDGSKQSQPLNTSKDQKKGGTAGSTSGSEVATVSAQPVRRRLPDTRHSLTHKFNVGGHEGYITVGLFEDGTPGELFITMAKEGSTIGGLMDVIGTETSLALQYGVPLDALVNKFSHARFEPSGWTSNPDIPHAKSVVDYIFRFLGITFLAGYREANSPNRNLAAAGYGQSAGDSGETAASSEVTAAAGNVPTVAQGAAAASPQPSAASPKDAAQVKAEHPANGQTNGNGNGHHPGTNRLIALLPSLQSPSATLQPTSRNSQFAGFQSDAPACDNCGAITVRNGNCYLCHNCGQSMGCS